MGLIKRWEGKTGDPSNTALAMLAAGDVDGIGRYAVIDGVVLVANAGQSVATVVERWQSDMARAACFWDADEHQNVEAIELRTPGGRTILDAWHMFTASILSKERPVVGEFGNLAVWVNAGTPLETMTGRYSEDIAAQGVWFASPAGIAFKAAQRQ